MLPRTRIVRTLEAGPELREALADALVRVSQLIVDFPQIAALTLDPLTLDADGVAIGAASIAVIAPGARPASLALPPYPADLVEHFEAHGEHLTIRPIRPEDAEAHTALFGRLTPEDIRYRFFSAVRALSAEQIVRLTQIDYDREMAFVAVREATGETVGVARLVRESLSEEGEFAVLVQGDMKGRGIATRLMHRLIDWARSRDMTAVVGQVLAENQPMLAFIRHLGFKIGRVPGEGGIVEARLDLDHDER
jgi:acetyltransferase